MNTPQIIIISIVAIVALAGVIFFVQADKQNNMQIETQIEITEQNVQEDTPQIDMVLQEEPKNDSENTPSPSNTDPKKSSREISITDGVNHSIPLSEIQGGGPAKDGIPSIDEPKFVDTKEADSFVTDEEIGLGITLNNESRFYPYQILVFHELVNDVIGGTPILVSYCPLCATGVVFERTVDGVVRDFGVSGFLWQSNVLMYDRTNPEEKESGGFRVTLSDFNPEEQSLWSQVLGEAVWGRNTGRKLKIIPSDAVRYGEWKKAHPNTLVLSRDTGARRSYGFDPYGGNTPIIGATNIDRRLPEKTFVFGVEHNNKYKAYPDERIPIGLTKDMFAGKEITIERSNEGEIRFFIGKDKTKLPTIGGFWFSWATVHPSTEIFE